MKEKDDLLGGATGQGLETGAVYDFGQSRFT